MKLPIPQLVALALVLAPALAGCAAPDATTPAPDGPSASASGANAPLADLRGCTGHNAFLQTTPDALVPHVPANWTFTRMAEGTAILRMFRAVCEGDVALLMLSTPMVPDEASLAHHDNPDVVIDVFTNDASAIARWEATGARAALAEFTEAPFPGGVSLIAQTDDGLVLGLDVLAQPLAQAGQPYEWQAVYAAGTEDAIGWLWGDEVAQTTLQHRYAVHLGPGTRVDAADAQPFAMGSEWVGFDVTYRPGLPAAGP